MYGYGYQYSTIKGGELSQGEILAAAYKARVEADGGTYTNGSCLVTFLNSLDPYLDNLLLDVYTGAAAAYSLRLLRTAYVGSAIRVRRSSDNTEQDIGFVSGALDTASLLTFCGVGDGFVTTWYDQSGNARNATQATAANQPQIVSSGSLLTTNSKPSILYDGSNDLLATSVNIGITGSVSRAVSLVVYRNLPTTNYIISYGTIAGTGYLSGVTTEYYLRNQSTTKNYNTTGSLSTQELIFVDGNAINLDGYNLYRNGVVGTPATATSGSTTLNTQASPLYIGNLLGTSANINARMQELILWGSNQSSNRSGIETNVNSYYGIY
jgi:hypothetical protein